MCKKHYDSLIYLLETEKRGENMEYTVMSNYVYDYIENEINYIKGDISRYGLQDGDIEDLNMLQNITKEQINKIAEKIIDESEFKENLGAIIHEYLYDYEKEKKEV